ncbi:MAG TPA: TIGR02391 family protein [Candidatus Binatia bacterium]|nr:TIGR02391 family protein [Candidatus Binatia bacterium]
MTVKAEVSELWKQGAFEKEASASTVNTLLRDQFGTTCANISVILKSCEFLRKDAGGWIQRYRHGTRTTPGTAATTDYFASLDIHPEITKVSKKLFDDGEYDDAVFKAYKRLNNIVKEKSGRNELDGQELMQKVFGTDSPTLKFNAHVTEAERNYQRGMMFLHSGAIAVARNPPAHEDTSGGDPVRARELLAFASFLCKRLDEISAPTQVSNAATAQKKNLNTSASS